MQSVSSFDQFYVNVHSADFSSQALANMRRYGLFTFDEIASSDDFLSFVQTLGVVRRHRDSDEKGITRISVIGSEHPEQVSGLGFTNKELFPHTDGSAASMPAAVVATLCTKPARTGGDSIFVDGQRIARALQNYFPETLEALCAPNSVVFGNPHGVHHLGSLIEVMPGKCAIRFRLDQWIYMNPSVAQALPILLKLIKECTFSFKLSAGQGYVAQNDRLLHGRNQFVGEREILRILVDSGSSVDFVAKVGTGFRLTDEARTDTSCKKVA